MVPDILIYSNWEPFSTFSFCFSVISVYLVRHHYVFLVRYLQDEMVLYQKEFLYLYSTCKTDLLYHL